MDGFWGQMLAFFVAFIPGVLIALIADFLSRRRDTERERRVNENARTLLALEVGSNLTALRDFWQTINGLDTERQRDGLEAHLAAMAQNGLLGYTAPRWSVARWERLAPQTAGALDKRDIFSLTRVYAGLREIGDLYGQILTIPDDERAILDGDRFWYNRFAGNRIRFFERLQRQVTETLSLGNPIGDSLEQK
jgi:hypothetical protein